MNYISLLPREIWRMIFDLSDIKTLKELLVTTHQMNRLVEPSLYHDVQIVRSPAAQAFKESITADEGRRALYVASLLIPEPMLMHTIFPYLTNLRRLGFTGLADESHELWETLRSLPPLTHLMWHNEVDDRKSFVRFLESQPSLQHLDIMSDDIGVKALKLSPNALPLLRTLRAETTQSLSIFPDRSVKHLELYTEHRRHMFLDDDASLASVVTLMCAQDEFHIMVKFATHFPSLKYLEIYSSGDIPSFVELGDALSSLKATKLEYICLTYGHATQSKDEMTLEDVEAIFEHLPSLRILEMEWEHCMTGATLRILRFHKENDEIYENTVKCDRPVPTSWGLWWEGRDLGVLWSVSIHYTAFLDLARF